MQGAEARPENAQGGLKLATYLGAEQTNPDYQAARSIVKVLGRKCD